MGTFANQQRVTSTSVRFRLAGGENPLILVPVQVHDEGPYEFILDTGASPVTGLSIASFSASSEDIMVLEAPVSKAN